MIWLGASAGAVGVTQYYIGYLLKAGHIAVVTHLVKTGSLPENQFAYGKEVVKEKFATAAAYFAVDRLVSGAVRQINGTLNIVGSFLEKFLEWSLWFPLPRPSSIFRLEIWMNVVWHTPFITRSSRPLRVQLTA